MIMRTLLLACMGFFAFSAASAAPYPTRLITLVIPFAPGGPTDLIGRAVAEGLAKELGQSVIVENKPGATGVVALDALSRSAPDGYTLFFLSSTTAIAHIAQKRSFTLTKQVIPLGNLITSPMIALVNPKMIDVSNLDQLVAFLRANPKTLYTSSGSGSPAHITTQAWAKQHGLELTHVPYKGIAPALVDVIGERVGIIFSTATSIKPYVEAGTLRPIAILGDQRLALVPNVRTSTEQGYPDMKILIRNGLVVAPGTPDAIVERLRSALRTVVGSDEYRKGFDSSDGSPEFINGPEWGRLVQEIYDAAAKSITDTGLSIE